MTSKWATYLTIMSENEKGGFTLAPIDRGLAYSEVYNVAGDVSGDTFKSEIRASPDAGGAALAEFTVTAGTFANGVTPLTFTLAESDFADLPDDDMDGVAEYLWSLLHFPDGGTEYLSAAGNVYIMGAVTDDD